MVLVPAVQPAGITEAERGRGRDGEVGAQFRQGRVLCDRGARHRKWLAGVKRQRGSRAYVAG